MSADEHWVANTPRRLTRFSLATLFVLVTAVAAAIAIGLEMSKSEVVAYVQIRRSVAPIGWPRDWTDEMSTDEYDSFRRTQVELMRSESLLIRALRDPSISHGTFLARASDPVKWLKENLKIDFPNDAELLRIRLWTRDPDDGVKVLNAVVRTYFKEVVEKVVQRRNRAELKLKELSDELKDQILREKKEVASLAKVLGEEAASQSPELELREARIRQQETVLDELNRYLHRLMLSKHAPLRVEFLDEASVRP
jgi:hypothetical protein